MSIVWTIAGSDSGGGAGLQADLKAFAAFGVHGCSAVAAITAQHSRAVERIDAVAPEVLDAQLAALAKDMPPSAIKTGLLGSVDNLRVVARWVDRLQVPLVVDPVLRATTGASFADDALVAAYRNELLPRATLATPNTREAELLGERALQRSGAHVITGGDDGGALSIDTLHTPQGSGTLALPRIEAPHHHGSGCVFASSAAAALALGFVEVEAVILAKMATAHALRHGYAAGQGAGPVHPQAGFALVRDNLPLLGPTGWSFPAMTADELGLYAIVDSADWVERVLATGVRTVQLRVKQANDLAAQVARAVAAARRHGARLFVNDHWRLAIEHGAFGVHLGQEDLPDADLNAISAAGLRLGVSTHAFWEVCRAAAVRPSYIACGPIHATLLKEMPWAPQGEDNLAYWCALLNGPPTSLRSAPEGELPPWGGPAAGDTPVVAIAGMDAPRAREAMRCGAAGVAVVGAITRAADPEAAIASLQAAVQAGRAAFASGDRRPVPALPKSTLLRALTDHAVPGQGDLPHAPR